MASAIFSRLLPHGIGEPSIYETLQENAELSDQSDIEERAGMALDEENLGQGFHDYELDDALVNDITSPTTLARIKSYTRNGSGRSPSTRAAATRSRRSLRKPVVEDLNDDVPQSLLIEGHDDAAAGLGDVEPDKMLPPAPIPTTLDTDLKWQRTQKQQRLYAAPEEIPPPSRNVPQRRRTPGMVHPREQALWRWANVENLDNFLKDLYDYFLGNGINCILLSRALNLLTLAFVVGFSTFLTSCIEYSKIPSSKTMSQILVPQCTKRMSGLSNLSIWLFAFLWICKGFQYVMDIQRLRNLHSFYHYLLNIPDSEMQTVSWQEVVKRLMLLRDSNPSTAGAVPEHHRRFMGTQSKQRMDAHDIANRLMRRDNYLIALINKDVLDLTLPIPFFRNRQLFSKTLEWNLNLCILDFVFNEKGQVRPHFLKDTHRRALSDGLRRRFMFAGLMNILCAPLIFLYFVLLYFFRYFNEFQQNPSQIGSRQYTPFAEWKFREFNELWHLFQRRVNMSYPFAMRYVDQFPKDKSVQMSRFVAFITGALVSVLALASLIDPEKPLSFEITPDRTVLFYLGVFGAVWRVARGGVPEENLVFDPEYALNNVTEYTHYMPSHWRGRLHSNEVRGEFALLYPMKVAIFLEEMLGIIFTPFILWFSLPKSSDRLVDFFREFTVHVDGLGYVCSYAVFDFKKGANNPAKADGGATQDLRQEYYSTKDGKMLASYYGFIDNYVTNQRPGAPYLHPVDQREFHPPPAFPGLMSPTLAPENRASSSRMEPKGRQPRGTSNVRQSGFATTQSYYRTPRFAPSRDPPSPMASILLDPQHQPSQPASRSRPHRATQSRLRVSHKALVDPIEDEAPAVAAEASHANVLNSDDAATADESNLGESWKTTRAGNAEDDVDDDAHARSTDKGPGVLGLVYQFSKAQTEGAGVNI